MKKKGNKLFPILGIVGFSLYILLYLIIMIYNFAMGNYYYATIPNTILRFLGTLVLDGIMVVYLIVSMTKHRTSKVTHILALIAVAIMTIINVKDLISQIIFMTKYIENMMGFKGYFIQEVSFAIEDIAAIMFHLWIWFMILGITIKKQFPYKLFMTLAFVALGFTVLAMLGEHIGSIMIYVNIRVVLSELFTFFKNIDLLLFLVALTITIYKNKEEI